MRTCTRCGQPKKPEEMIKDRRRRDGLGSWCHTCQRGNTKKSRSTRDPEDRRVKDNDYHHGRKDDPTYLRNRKAARTKLRYGISLEEMEHMELMQGGGCAICGIKGKRLVIDHDHITGQVRGLLCYSCNIKLAGLDDESWSGKAAIYLSMAADAWIQEM